MLTTPSMTTSSVEVQGDVSSDKTGLPLAYPAGAVSVSFTHEVSPSKSKGTTGTAPALLQVSLRNVHYDKDRKDMDARRLFEVIDKNRAHLREWLPWLDFVRKYEDEFFFLEKSQSDGEAGKSFVQVIEVREVGMCSESDAQEQDQEQHKPVIAGTCGFNFLDHEKKIGYIGYWLSKEFEGIGLMTKCVEQLIERIGEKQLKLQHFDISCAVGNLKSQTVAQKLEGFVKLQGVKDVQTLYGKEHELMSYVKTVVEKPEFTAREARKDYYIRDLMRA